MSLVNYEKRGGVGLVVIDNPPVNAFSIGVPRGIVDALAEAAADAEVAAVVVAGAGRTFIAGADIRRLGAWPADEPNLRDAIAACETIEKPVVAAIHGHALGGGLELAMACHYRVSTGDARLGQPEVRIGVPPGAGGTQRLPRLVGAEKALEMILSAAPITGMEAARIGLVDRVAEGDLRGEALAFAAEAAARGGPHPRVRDREVRLDDPGIFDATRQRIERRARGQRAPYACIECVEAAVQLPFDEGLAREYAIFDAQVRSPEAAALRHVFFAERQIAKVPGIGKDTRVHDIREGAVIGAGTMGSGIAMNFANAGIPVKLLDLGPEQLQRAMAAIERNYASTVRKGRLSEAAMRERLARITPVTGFDALASADFVIEAVFEEMALKLETFARLDAACKAEAIIASNTSYLDVNRIAATTGRPSQVLGTHFFSPANVMRLLEVVRIERVGDEVLATALALGRRMGKVPVVSGVCHGFIGNRMLEGYLREAAFLVEEGALPQDVDRVLTDFGFPMGPFAVSDLAGLDIGWRSRREHRAAEDERRYSGAISDRLCERGCFGQKTGSGYYRYEAGSRAPLPSPEVEALIEAVSVELGIERRRIGDEEILSRCLYPLINEGARVLDEGIALRAGDIDIVWLNGYGFPAHRGGPMHYADTVGIASIHRCICEYHEHHGAWWEPAPLLARMAKAGTTFAERDA